MDDRLEDQQPRGKSRRSPRRVFLSLLFLCSFLMAVIGYLTVIRERIQPENPVHVAHEFVGEIKRGESCDQNGCTGYEAAHQLLSEEAQAAYPWPEFLLTFAALTRDHGSIQASEEIMKNQTSRRRRLVYNFKLYLSRSNRDSLDSMSCYLLRVRVGPLGSTYRVDSFDLEPIL
jgi:hypothetical protein